MVRDTYTKEDREAALDIINDKTRLNIGVRTLGILLNMQTAKLYKALRKGESADGTATLNGIRCYKVGREWRANRQDAEKLILGVSEG